MTPYDRLARDTPGFRHWRLPVAALVGVGLYGVVSIALSVLLVIGLIVTGVDEDAWLDAASTQIAVDRPSILAFQLGTIALLLPCVLAAVALVWRPHVRYLHSVEGRVRWRWLARCTAVAFVVVAVALGLSLVVEAATGETLRLDSLDGPRIAGLVIVLVLVPFQASAEEYVFRGALLQLVGSWTHRAAIPVIVTSLLFAAGHVYDLWGLLSVFLFGVIAAVMTIRTGGLEAAIGLHIANNVLLMVLDVFGLVDSSGEESGGPLEVVTSTLMALIFWAIVEAMARRSGLQRRRPPLPEPPPRYLVVPPPPYVPPPPQVPAGGATPGPSTPGDEPAGPPPPLPPNAPSYPGDPGRWGR